MFKNGIFFTFVCWCLWGCDEISNIVIKNDSNKRVYVILSMLYPDTSLSIIFKDSSLFTSRYQDSVFVGLFHDVPRPRFAQIKPRETETFGLLGNNAWEREIRYKNKYEKLVFYFFDANTIDSIGWQKAFNRNVFLKVNIQSIPELKKSDWTITYK